MRIRKVTANVVRRMMPELRDVPNDELGAILWAVDMTMTREEREVARDILGREMNRRARAIMAEMNRLARFLCDGDGEL